MVTAPRFRAALLEVLDEALAVEDAACGLLQVWDPARGGVEVVAQRGFDREFLDQFRLVRPGDPSTCGRALGLKQRVLIPDVDADPFFTRFLPLARRAGFRAVQSTPIMGTENQILGILSTHFIGVRYLSRAATSALDRCAAKAGQLIEAELAASSSGPRASD
jgi:GAF domain-containing protein